MILAELRDFRGCERADLRCDPICLCAGKNAAGKSSIAQAVGAVLAGTALPLAEVTKGSAGLMVKTGAAAASVAISGAHGHARIEWPSCQVTAEGEAPRASEWAAGLKSIATMPPKERGEVLGQYLKTDPVREDVAAALADQVLDGIVDAVWDLIEQHGWNGAHQLRRERGAEFKGRWRQVTGQNYGSRIAAAWVPKGWGEWMQATEDDLLAAVAKAKEAHEAAVAGAAVSAAERRALAVEVDAINQYRKDVAAAEVAEAEAAQALLEKRQARARLPPATGEAGMPCPHCGQPVIFRQVSLVERVLEKAAPVAAAELKRRRTAIADADGEVSRLGGEHALKSQAAAKAREALSHAVAAQQRLAKLPPEGQTAGDVEKARAELAAAEGRLAGFRQKAEADDLKEKIQVNERVLEILAPEGLRTKRLGRVLDLFMQQLARLDQAAGWKAVGVDAAMTILYGGRPYALCSTSEQYRARAVLQVAMALIDQSSLVVLDAADILDAPTRSGLFALLEEAQVPALVCMTLARREQLPDLAAAGLGSSYWIENGILEPLHPVEEAA